MYINEPLLGTVFILISYTALPNPSISLDLTVIILCLFTVLKLPLLATPNSFLTQPNA